MMFEFVPLTEDFVSSSCRLSAIVGWNQTEEDWRRLLRQNPEGVKVWIDGGEVRASYSVAGYHGGAAWIGMILADPDYRGRGLGKSAFAEAMTMAGAGGYSFIGLDASEMGEGIYQKCGFERICPIVRWGGELRARRSAGVTLEPGLSAEISELDLRCTGIDRSSLLADLGRSAEIYHFKREGVLSAYCAIRPGREAWHVGPVVALSRLDFEQLFHGIATRFDGRPVICDLLQEGASSVLAEHGLQPYRTLQRMTKPRQERCLRGAEVWCATAFEWG